MNSGLKTIMLKLYGSFSLLFTNPTLGRGGEDGNQASKMAEAGYFSFP